MRYIGLETKCRQDNIRVLASENAKKFLFYILKTYVIYYTISFYNSPNISDSIFTYNSLK